MGKHNGYLEVIAGPMYSGKTEELIRQVKRAIIGKKKVQVFNHVIDTRYGNDNKIYSHAGINIDAHRIKQASEILKKLKPNSEIVAIDEAQWFGEELIDVVQQLVEMGKSVLVAGLALTYDRQPFPPVPHLMALADKAIKLAAICVICGTEAIYHKRISNLNNIKNANPLSPDPRFVDHNSYEARCRRCFAK